LVSTAHAVFRKLAVAASRARGSFGMRGVTQVGHGTRLDGMPFVSNEGSIRIGNELYLSSNPVQSHLVTREGGSITIGDRVRVGCGAAVASEASITIGSGVSIAAGCLLLDTDFHGTDDYDEANKAVPVVIEDGVYLGRGVVVLKGARIGRGARIAPGSVVSGVVPAGIAVSGVPARAQRAAGSRRDDASQDPAEILERVRTAVSEVFAGSGPVESGDGPATIPGWDSLGALRLLLALEDEFRIVFDDDALRSAKTVDEVARAVAGALRLDSLRDTGPVQ
jgi:acetyltransferase-like isoleucine patch superfamily enzyme/acyl carrier protein